MREPAHAYPLNNMNSESCAIPETPSISDIIQPLKSTFLMSDFDTALQLLLTRDQTLKQHFHSTLSSKCDAFDELMTQKSVAGLEKEHDAVRCEEIKEVLMKNEVLEREKEELARVCSARDEEIERIRMKNAGLEKENDDLRRNDAVKREKIKEVLMKNEVLEREKGEAVRERDEKIDELKKEKEGPEIVINEIEDRLLKLEGDMLTCFCIDLKKDVRFSSSKFGKIFSEIDNILDSEGVGITCRAQAQAQAQDTVAVHIPLVPEVEKSRENRPTGIT